MTGWKLYTETPLFKGLKEIADNGGVSYSDFQRLASKYGLPDRWLGFEGYLLDGDGRTVRLSPEGIKLLESASPGRQK